MPGTEVIVFNSAQDTALAPKVLPGLGVGERAQAVTVQCAKYCDGGVGCAQVPPGQTANPGVRIYEAFQDNFLVWEG